SNHGFGSSVFQVTQWQTNDFYPGLCGRQFASNGKHTLEPSENDRLRLALGEAFTALWLILFSDRTQKRVEKKTP
uniref:Uncharacterized protein n=1 Tax=Anopheles atroparvus TaxID=41427 RepID=A0AAG5D5B3_ANOAO